MQSWATVCTPAPQAQGLHLCAYQQSHVSSLQQLQPALNTQTANQPNIPPCN